MAYSARSSTTTDVTARTRVLVGLTGLPAWAGDVVEQLAGDLDRATSGRHSWVAPPHVLNGRPRAFVAINPAVNTSPWTDRRGPARRTAG